MVCPGSTYRLGETWSVRKPSGSAVVPAAKTSVSVRIHYGIGAARDALHSNAARFAGGSPSRSLRSQSANGPCSRAPDAAVDRQHLTRDPRRVVRGQAHQRVRDVLRTAEAAHVGAFEVFALLVRAAAIPCFLGPRLRDDAARSDRVDGDAERSE